MKIGASTVCVSTVCVCANFSQICIFFVRTIIDMYVIDHQLLYTTTI